MQMELKRYVVIAFGSYVRITLKMAKSITRSNIFEWWNKKTKDLKFVSTNILVSFLRPFFENGLSKETEILVKTNFRSTDFFSPFKNVASGYTLCHETISPNQHI